MHKNMNLLALKHKFQQIEFRAYFPGSRNGLSAENRREPIQID